uniref:Uncharacterized protein n=1 Tax=Pseudonaja textilis TaxID=8673 RepID=A0A670ZGV6_PSETE
MAAKENPCRKFQANIFNKSKCQNCFKPRESHLLNDEDLNQVRPSWARREAGRTSRLLQGSNLRQKRRSEPGGPAGGLWFPWDTGVEGGG